MIIIMVLNFDTAFDQLIFDLGLGSDQAASTKLLNLLNLIRSIIRHPNWHDNQPNLDAEVSIKPMISVRIFHLRWIIPNLDDLSHPKAHYKCMNKSHKWIIPKRMTPVILIWMT